MPDFSSWRSMDVVQIAETRREVETDRQRAVGPRVGAQGRRDRDGAVAAHAEAADEVTLVRAAREQCVPRERPVNVVAEAADAEMMADRHAALSHQFIIDDQTHFVHDDFNQEGLLDLGVFASEHWNPALDASQLSLSYYKFENYVRQINSDGSQFSYIIGPRQGRSNSKEQYAYIFDTAKFRLTSQPYVADDPTGILHRPPLIASFQCAQAPIGEGFSFTVLNLHIDPDDVDAEFQALERIMPQLFQNHPHEDDYIVMGDFNDSGNKFKHYRWLSNQFPLIRSNWSTKVRSGRSIDNIVIDGMRTEEYRNQSGVLNFTQQYQLSIQDSLQLSDHYPVWAVFSTVEAQPRFASNR